MDIRAEINKDASSPQDVVKHDDVVKIVWQGERIAKLVFASGKVIDFTRSDDEGRRAASRRRAAGDR
ncbi:MAG: hypothetical protein GX161_02885 [Firmicutes bacterium]|jgi:hypothetical protein|nr:hypothetical protein [Bacillota bacterium]